MVQTHQRIQNRANGHANRHANAHAQEKSTNGFAIISDSDEKTDYSRWRLLDESGRHTWHYLTTDKEIKAWPQTIADKFHLGLPTVSFDSVHKDVSDSHRTCQSCPAQRDLRNP
jgi:hypothetical protein